MSLNSLRSTLSEAKTDVSRLSLCSLFEPDTKVIGPVVLRIRPVVVVIRGVVAVVVLREAISTGSVGHDTHEHAPVVDGAPSARGTVVCGWVPAAVGGIPVHAILVVVAGLGTAGVVRHRHCVAINLTI